MYGIIMAGGVGKRFWPMSRNRRPKQFLKLFGERSMIQMTYDRLQPVIPPENILVITNKKQVKLTAGHLAELPGHNIIAEPVGKDTAPCIGLGAILAMHNDPESVMVVLPSDHLITDVREFQRIIKMGADLAADNDYLITIGIEPTRPETGYGYIQIDSNSKAPPLSEKFQNKDIFRVKTFAEKPNLETAKRLIESGDFMWNSGIFIWKAQAILREIEELLPELFETLMEIKAHIGKKSFDRALLRAYRPVMSISIDYGVMEKARNVFLIKGTFGWSDVGNWEEFYKQSTKDKYGNVIIGTAEVTNSHNNLIISDEKLVAATGLNNMTVVNTSNAVLVCPRNNSQQVKEIVDSLHRKRMKRFL